ncbi:unnamed protein product, partial [Sphagnum jensenii]
EDDPRSGRSSTAVNKESIAGVLVEVQEDPHVTVKEIAQEVGISGGSCLTTLTDHLQYRKLHIRVKEHLQSEQSSVKRYLAVCHSTSIAVEILAHDSDEKNLRLREAILIMDCKPDMNAKEEEKALLSLVRPVM